LVLIASNIYAEMTRSLLTV